jgi:hypothetical protein
MPGFGSQVIERAASRLKFPQAFGVFLALFLLDLVLPDLVPFVDEILLGLGATLFGLWRERVATAEGGAKPPEKNVTPPPAA